jgi:hypothetical protein
VRTEHHANRDVQVQEQLTGTMSDGLGEATPELNPASDSVGTLRGEEALDVEGESQIGSIRMIVLYA